MPYHEINVFKSSRTSLFVINIHLLVNRSVFIDLNPPVIWLCVKLDQFQSDCRS